MATNGCIQNVSWMVSKLQEKNLDRCCRWLIHMPWLSDREGDRKCKAIGLKNFPRKYDKLKIYSCIYGFIYVCISFRRSSTCMECSLSTIHPRRRYSRMSYLFPEVLQVQDYICQVDVEVLELCWHECTIGKVLPCDEKKYLNSVSFSWRNRTLIHR